MKFFGNGIIWDAENNKNLCKFENGEFETENKRVIHILTEMGYENDGMREEEIKENEEVIEEVVEIKLNDKTVAELRNIAKERGIEGIYRKSKEELIELIEGD